MRRLGAFLYDFTIPYQRHEETGGEDKTTSYTPTHGRISDYAATYSMGYA
jgi:hypothetical protein